MISQRLPELFLGYNNPKVLDLGCDLPTYFFKQHVKGFEFSYVGVDEKSEFEICKSGYDSSIEPANYLMFIKFKSLHDYLSGEQLVFEDFQNLYNFHFKTTLLDYLESETGTFDIVVLSNVLHFIEDKETAKNAVKRLKTIMEPNGLMYISVRRVSEAGNHPYTLEEAQELIGQSEVVWNNFADQTETIQFILQR
jgi:hypothetical protein